MDEKTSISNLGLSYKSSEAPINSIEPFKSNFKCHVLDIYSVPKLPTICSFGGVFNDCFGGISDLKLMEWSDFSDISSVHSDASSFDKNCSVPCLESYEDLKRKCETIGLKFSDCSKDIIAVQAEESQCNLLYLENVTVRCLDKKEELKKKCKALGLEFVDFSLSNKVYEEEYEVDFILEERFEENQKYYFVKWKNYGLNTMTWEPAHHLSGCNEMIKYFESIKSSENQFNRNLFSYFLKDLLSRKPYDRLTLVKLICIVTGVSEDSLIKDRFTVTQLKLKAKEFMDYPFQRILSKRKDLLKLMRFSAKRKVVLVNLEEWEHKINSFNPATYVDVENNVDLETAPTDFQFVHDYVSGSIEFPEELAVFCECNNCHESKSSCCPKDSDAHFAYNKFRRLQLLPGYPIYECNKCCKCGDDCVNRVVQHGPKIRVSIFRTSNECGWGLKTLETIQKDQFVLEYLGEILNSEEAEERGKEYDTVGRSYLFDLDYGDCMYTVDAGRMGNASHFINHSCEPNLHVFAVWINCQDPQLPRLAFFAKRKINRGEELTFDYKMNVNKDKSAPRNLETGTMLCKCNSRKCRKYLC